MRSSLPPSAYFTYFLMFIGAWSFSRAQTQPNPPGRYHNLENRAKNAKTEDWQTMHALAHEVIATPHFFSIPTSLASELEEDLTRAEVNYRANKKSNAVSEMDLVLLLNNIMEALRAPSYLRTTQAQFRRLRMHLVIEEPVFIGSGLTGMSLRRGQSVDPGLSPLQAAHLLSVMIDQKLRNENYQDPDVDLGRAEKAHVEAAKRASVANSNSKHVGLLSSNPKRREVEVAIDSGTQSIDARTASDLVDQMFKTFKLSIL